MIAPELLERARGGDAAAMDELVRGNAGLIWSVVRRFFGRAEPDDLFQLGSIGLMKAIRGFDPAFGTCFSTYAVPKIAGEMRRFLRDDGPLKISRTLRAQSARVQQAQETFQRREGRAPRLDELCALTGISREELALCEEGLLPPRSLDEPVGEDGATLYELTAQATDVGVDRLALGEALGRLEPRLRQVLLLRYFRDWTQQRVAAALGMTQVQVSRAEHRALTRLRELLREE